MNAPVIACMQAPGPKRILTCDGGGILGLMSVEILAKLEVDLRAKLEKPDLVLADWFDFVCGTSTIIATCISVGMSMDRIRAFYVGSGTQMFDKRPCSSGCTTATRGALYSPTHPGGMAGGAEPLGTWGDGGLALGILVGVWRVCWACRQRYTSRAGQGPRGGDGGVAIAGLPPSSSATISGRARCRL